MNRTWSENQQRLASGEAAVIEFCKLPTTCGVYSCGITHFFSNHLRPLISQKANQDLVCFTIFRPELPWIPNPIEFGWFFFPGETSSTIWQEPLLSHSPKTMSRPSGLFATPEPIKSPESTLSPSPSVREVKKSSTLEGFKFNTKK